jgi:hypothetical protein
MHTLERHVMESTAAWEQEGIAHGEIRPVIGAVDVTFLQRIMLVFMDLSTGYLLRQEVAADRSFDTWFERAHERLTTFGTEVLYLVRDRAKALIKLAHTGFGCPSIPGLFHLSHNLAKGYSLAIFARLRQAKRELEQAKQHLEKSQQNSRLCPNRPGPGSGSGLCHLAPSLAGGGQDLAAALVQFVAPPASLAAWKAWAADHAKTFQRASSAVEGRNGYLSQMQHNHRGLPARRYPVWTALHNFDGRAKDGTTPASRFFRRSFPDLFESVLSQIDELPMPRQRRQALATSH